MPSTESSHNTEELAAEIHAIRADIQNLTSTVGRIANKQLGRVQDKAIETANEAEDAIRRNPLLAVCVIDALASSRRSRETRAECCCKLLSSCNGATLAKV